ncbi:hypothetical protein ACFL7M_05605 [Thermodesulfobacteriota bacterium]
MNRTSLILISILTILIAIFSVPANAFYEWQGEEGYIDLRGMIRGFGTAYKYPENDFFFKDRSDTGLVGLARLIMQARAGRHLNFELNAYQVYIPKALVTSQAGLETTLDVERSDILEWSFSDKKYVHAAIDRLNARWSNDHLDLVVGRQPINLATTFFFTPNDFFAPFSAQVFYRVYKPGVDAVRADVRLGDLSQLSLMSVLGYSRDPYSDTGWSNSPKGGRTSYVSRVSTVFHDFEWSLIGGVVRKADIIGGSLQGELFNWLGVRAEGHVANPDDSQQEPYSEVSIGFEHRWESSLDVRLEQFYNGSSSGSISDYGALMTSAKGKSQYLGRNYTAVGMGYEFTPLLNAQILVITNLDDDSYLWKLNAIYSLSNESELALDFGVPLGKKPESTAVKSEFGLYPYSINIEIRYFF